MPLATWQGPYDALLPDKRLLHVGDEYDVSDADLESAHWQAVKTDQPARPSNLTVEVAAEKGAD